MAHPEWFVLFSRATHPAPTQTPLGEVAEWPIAPVLKTGRGVSSSWVQIPPSPLEFPPIVIPNSLTVTFHPLMLDKGDFVAMHSVRFAQKMSRRDQRGFLEFKMALMAD